jgi:tetratricopeptide (TPR) repeat protein
MNPRIRLLSATTLVIVALVAFGCADRPPEEAWQRDVEMANALFRQGRYVEAEASYRQIVAVAERFGSKDLRLATSVNNLAAVCDSLGKAEEAEALYRRVLSIREAALGPDDPSVAKSLNNLAAFRQYDSGQGEIGPLLERALEIRKKAVGLDPAWVAQSFDNLGLYNFVEGRDAEAEKFWKQSLEIREKLGSKSPDIAMTLASIGFAELAQGKRDEAKSFVERASAALPTKPAFVVEAPLVEATHPDRAIRLASLPGEFAEPIYRRRAILCRRVFGASSVQAVQGGQALANLLRRLDRAHEAAAIEARLATVPSPAGSSAASATSGAALPATGGAAR